MTTTTTWHAIKTYHDVATLWYCSQVAVLCNHQRSVPKGHQTSMAKMDQRITDVEAEIAELKAQVVALQKGTYKAPEGKKAPNIDAYVLGWCGELGVWELV